LKLGRREIAVHDRGYWVEFLALLNRQFEERLVRIDLQRFQEPAAEGDVMSISELTNGKCGHIVTEEDWVRKLWADQQFDKTIPDRKSFDRPAVRFQTHEGLPLTGRNCRTWLSSSILSPRLCTRHLTRRTTLAFAQGVHAKHGSAMTSG
jgi:hypothetical protein